MRFIIKSVPRPTDIGNLRIPGQASRRAHMEERYLAKQFTKPSRPTLDQALDTREPMFNPRHVTAGLGLVEETSWQMFIRDLVKDSPNEMAVRSGLHTRMLHEKLHPALRHAIAQRTARYYQHARANNLFRSEAFCEALEEEFAKGAGHKYIRRLANPRPPPKWNYIYSLGSGKHGSKFQEGEKVRIAHGDKKGHFHVKKVDGDHLHIHHDETGKEMRVHRDVFRKMFQDHHKEGIDESHAKLKDVHARASKHGSEKQKARAKARLEAFESGHGRKQAEEAPAAEAKEEPSKEPKGKKSKIKGAPKADSNVLRKIPGKDGKKAKHVYDVKHSAHTKPFTEGEFLKISHGGEAGHYHVDKVEYDAKRERAIASDKDTKQMLPDVQNERQVTITHTQTGHQMTLSQGELRKMFAEEHQDTVAAHGRELSRRLKRAKDGLTRGRVMKQIKQLNQVYGHEVSAGAATDVVHDFATQQGYDSHEFASKILNLPKEKLDATIQGLAAKAGTDAETVRAELDDWAGKGEFKPKEANPEALPPGGRMAAFDALLEAGGISDSDFHQGNAAFRKWMAAGRKGEGPKPYKGQELDAMVQEAMEAQKHRKNPRRPSGTLEAFMMLTSGARTWADLQLAIDKLREVKGHESVRMPEEVLQHYGEQSLQEEMARREEEARQRAEDEPQEREPGQDELTPEEEAEMRRRQAEQPDDLSDIPF